MMPYLLTRSLNKSATIFLLIVAVSVLPIVIEVGKRMIRARKTPLSEATDAIEHLDPELTLRGLSEIYRRNRTE